MGQHRYEYSLNLRKILIFVRKKYKVTQKELATVLNMKQNRISQIESGRLLLSAPEWAIFCHHFKISPQSILTGQIDNISNHNFDLLNIDRFKIESSYTNAPTFKVRFLNPLLNYCKMQLGEEVFEKEASYFLGDPYYYINHNHPLNFNFKIKLTDFLVNVLHKDISDIFEDPKMEFNSELNHGDLHYEYLKGKSPFDVLKIFINNWNLYENNFIPQIEESNENEKIITLHPKEKFQEFASSRNEIYQKAIGEYNYHFIKNLLRYETNDNSFRLTKMKDTHKGDRCLAIKVKMV